ncbi:hypothetical protein Tco_1036030 [Tanacetum coccineum]
MGMELLAKVKARIICDRKFIKATFPYEGKIIVYTDQRSGYLRIVYVTKSCSAAFRDEFSRSTHDRMDTLWIQELMKKLKGLLKKIVCTFLVCSLSRIVSDDRVKVDLGSTEGFVVICNTSRKVLVVFLRHRRKKYICLFIKAIERIIRGDIPTHAID